MLKKLQKTRNLKNAKRDNENCLFLDYESNSKFLRQKNAG